MKVVDITKFTKLYHDEKEISTINKNNKKSIKNAQKRWFYTV